MSKGFVDVRHGPMRLLVDIDEPLTKAQLLALVPIVEAMATAAEAFEVGS